MKSIMEEASSLGKAIEQAWNRAGKPTNFSVKIFEEAKKNILGMTVNPAKIALFFDGRPGMTTPPEIAHDFKKAHPAAQPQRPLYEKQKRVAWSPDMIEFGTQWIKQTLHIMGLPNIQFSVTTAGNLLRVQFSDHITGKEEGDRALFSGFAHLLMTTLRQKYKRSLAHLKIVLLCK